MSLLIRSINPGPSREVVDQSGVIRKLGAHAPPADRPRMGLRWGDVAPVLPRAKWREMSLATGNIPIYDQGQRNSCVGNSGAGAFSTAWELAGNDPVKFDANFLYAQVNDNRDEGAVVDDCGVAVEDGGLIPEADNPHGLMYLGQFPAALKAKAKRFRGFGRLHTPSFDEKASAILHGWAIQFGIMVGQAFIAVDDEGIPPLTGYPEGGHALYGRGLRWSRRYREWTIETVNSWTTDFGIKGVCYLRERHFAARDDAWAIRAPRPDPEGDYGPAARD